MKLFLIIMCAVFLSTSALHAQNIKLKSTNNPSQDNLKIALKDSLHPDIYVDGIKYDYKIVDLLDPSKIQSINVLKDEKSLKEYEAPNGVILITSKKVENNDDTTKIRIRGTSTNDGKLPMVVIDGKVASQEELGKLSPSDIESIEVLKNEKAMEKYKAPNGVIVVKTK